MFFFKEARRGFESSKAVFVPTHSSLIYSIGWPRMYYGGCSTSNLLHLLERALLHFERRPKAAKAEKK